MPKFSVRLYDEYCTEFLVEAANAQEAQDVVDQHETLGEDAPKVEPRITHVFPREYVGSGDTMVWRLDENGEQVDEED